MAVVECNANLAGILGGDGPMIKPRGNISLYRLLCFLFDY